MATKKKATDMLEDPFRFDPTRPDPPVSKGMGYLTKTDGLALEILTRTNKDIVAAIAAGYAYAVRYNSPYIKNKIEQLERLAISAGGKGRQELIDVVHAGGALPDAFYDRQYSNGDTLVTDDERGRRSQGHVIDSAP